MTLSKIHPQSDLLRYLDGGLTADEKSAIEKHLASCESCRNYLADVRNFSQNLANLTNEEFTSEEPHPDSWTLVAYEAGQVDEDTARHLRAHLLFCDSCQEEFYALRHMSEQESWREVIEHLKESVIDLAKSLGPNTLVGSVRIVAEQPAIAWRGGGFPKVLSKVLEVPVGENSYSLQVTAPRDGSIVCDIAGVRTPAREPLIASVLSGSKTELLSAQTDNFGNVHFAIPASEVPEDLLLFKFALRDHLKEFLIRVPKTPESD